LEITRWKTVSAGNHANTPSATTAQAPGPARKAWEKGREQAKDNKLEQAQKSFEKAVEIYPRFAAAWCDLGRAQLRSSNLEGARHSFEQSVTADSKYVGPYGGLAQIALMERNWQGAADATNKLLALDPVSFVEAWYFNATANFYLGDFDAAEKSVRQGLKLDQDHHVVKFEYLLGLRFGFRGLGQREGRNCDSYDNRQDQFAHFDSPYLKIITQAGRRQTEACRAPTLCLC